MRAETFSTYRTKKGSRFVYKLTNIWLPMLFSKLGKSIIMEGKKNVPCIRSFYDFIVVGEVFFSSDYFSFFSSQTK